MNEEAICELAKKHMLDLGMRSQPRLVRLTETTLGYRRPEGLTHYGTNLMAFANALILAERERCAKVCEKANATYGDYFAAAIRKGETS